MIECAHLVYVSFLPCLAAGLVVGVGWRFVDVGPVRTAMQWIAAMLFFVPQPFALYLGAYSAGVRIYQQALLAGWGLGIGVLTAAQLAGMSVTRWRPAGACGNSVVRLGVAIAMTALGVYAGWNVIGDYVLAPEIVRGTVSQARLVHHTRSPHTYEVTIGSRRHNITLDLLSLMNRGDYVEADAGTASSTIVAVRRVAHLSSTGPTR